MYKQDLALDDQQGLTCHKTQPNPTKGVGLLYGRVI